MRNKYPGQCYRCGQLVKPREGHFERHAGGWRVQHASCARTTRYPGSVDVPPEIREKYGDDLLNALNGG